MANKRMFDKSIIDSDQFLDMPLTSQAVYFHLNMRADDYGFVDNWKSILRIVGGKEDDIKVLIMKKLIIPFKSGVIVISHWKLNNNLQKDRIKSTKYIDELRHLKLNESKEYELIDNDEESNILLETGIKETPEWQKKRDDAYKNSSLPYSFLYKIRNSFDNENCPVCGKLMRINSDIKGNMPSIQHLVPISKGGVHELDNIAVICYECNNAIRDEIVNEKLNSDLVKKKWEFLSRSASGYVDKNSIDKNSIEENSITYSSAKAEQHDQNLKEIIDYLNLKSGKHYKYTANNINKIKARIREGFTIDDFKIVIEKKCEEWLNNNEMNRYLRPETLFGNKFESYLNQNNKVNRKITPDWFYKTFEEEEMSEDERRELEAIENGTYRP